MGFLSLCLSFFCLFFVGRFVFFYFNHLGTPTGIYPENFVKIGLDLAEIYRILKNIYFFVCLFVCLLTGFFYFNHLGSPTGIYPENFVKIPLDLAEILRIRKLDWKMFTCLFVCFFCLYIRYFFALIIIEYPKKVSLKIL